MAAPSLTCKQHKLFFKTSSFAKSESAYVNVTNKHIFSDLMTFVCPGAGPLLRLSEPLKGATTDQCYHHVQGVPLAKFIDVEFIDAFVKAGDIYVLSENIHHGSDLCVAIYPPGLLELSVTKDLYEELGLEGTKMAPAERRTLRRHLVSIDLTAEGFRPGRKRYERAKWCFTDRLALTADYTVAWVPRDDRICPSSIGAYFSRCGYLTNLGKLGQDYRSLTHAPIPVVDWLTTEASEASCGFMELYEWLGMIACDCLATTRDSMNVYVCIAPCSDVSGTVDPYISTYSCPEPRGATHNLTRARLRGFHTPHTTRRIIAGLREWLKQNGLPWAAVTVHGLQWPRSMTGAKELERLYTYTLFSDDDKYWVYSTEPI